MRPPATRVTMASGVVPSAVDLAPPYRIRRRRGLALALRQLMGRQPMPRRAAGADPLALRLRELVRESGQSIPDADQAEWLARLDLHDFLPPEMLVAVCAALLPLFAAPHAPGASS